jgi:hypothetical protein
MMTPAVLARVVHTGYFEGAALCVIWRRLDGCWDYVCRAPHFDAERLIMLDQQDRGTKRRDYQVNMEPEP